MTDPPGAPCLNEPLYIIRYLGTKCSLDQVVLLDLFPYLVDILVREVFDLAPGIDLGTLQDDLRGRSPDTEYVREGNFNSFILRQINTCNPCQKNLLLAAASSPDAAYALDSDR